MHTHNKGKRARFSCFFSFFFICNLNRSVQTVCELCGSFSFPFSNVLLLLMVFIELLQTRMQKGVCVCVKMKSPQSNMVHPLPLCHILSPKRCSNYMWNPYKWRLICQCAEHTEHNEMVCTLKTTTTTTTWKLPF